MKSPKQYECIYIDNEKYSSLDGAWIYPMDDLKRGISFLQFNNYIFNQNDWSDYVEFEEGHVEVYYDGNLIFTDK